jgi:hypothetical protein
MSIGGKAMKIIAGAAALLTLTSFAALPVQGADPRAYEFITVDLPDGLVPYAFEFGNIPSGGVGGINDRGWIVGGYSTGTVGHPNFGAFLDTGRTFTTINVPSTKGGAVAGTGVNNRGTAVGIYNVGGIEYHKGFIYRNGNFTFIDELPGITGGFAIVHPAGINNNGTIVGWGGRGRVGDYQQHGFVRSARGQITLFDYPLAFSTFPTGINDKSVIVGDYDIGIGGLAGAPLTGFLRQPDGALSKIQVPGASETVVEGINNAGDVVGYYQTGTATHGFLLDGGGYVTIDVPGASSTEVTGINNHGELAGLFDDAKGPHVFVARPQEEEED